MILSFKGKCAEDIFHGRNSKSARVLPRYLHELASEKLDIINTAHGLEDLKIPPGNRLEMLRGNLKDKYSIRINEQWRIVFNWENGHAKNVEIMDYH